VLVPPLLSLARLAVIAIALATSNASGQVVCTMPDGSVHTGTRIPKGCAVKDKYRGLVNPGQPPADPAASAARARRAESRREADAIARELRAVDARIAAVPELDPAAYANDTSGWHAQERDLAVRDATIGRLRSRQTELQWRLDSLKRELASLTASP